MKFKTTTKALKNGYSNIKCAGYCDLQSLLYFHDPVAYTCGIYGWNYDAYYVNGVMICTGYRGMPGERAESISHYERHAREILNNWNIPYDRKREMVEELLREFCAINGGRA